jgi:hypothetical protein
MPFRQGDVIMERDEQGRFLPRENQQQDPRLRNYPPGPAMRGAAAGARQSSGRPWMTAAGSPSCAKPGGIAATVGILAGAGIGAAMMFLMDPEQGRRRRERIAAAAAHSLEATTDAARHAWDAGSEHAVEGAAALYAQVPSGKDVRKFGHRLFDRTGSAFGSAADTTRETAGGWLDSAKSYLPEVRSRRTHQHDLSPAAAGAGAAGALLLGLGAMWLFDPDRGRGRRAWIGQKTSRAVNETGRFMRATGRHLANKSKGFYHEGRRAVTSAGESLTDSAVAEHVRTALGRLGLSGQSSVSVECTGGCVTLSGRCVADDVDTVITTVRDTYGVSGVTNNMEVGSRFDSPTSTSPTTAL